MENMITKIREKISEYMTKYSDMDDWKSIRKNYFYFSYMTFLVLAVKELKGSVDSLREEAIQFGLENRVIIDYLFELSGMESFVHEIVVLGNQLGMQEVNVLYQEFLSVDYMIDGRKVVFNGGKNSRDVLGAYYTQEQFAYEIVKKIVSDYQKSSGSCGKKIKIADLSCGGGAFLVAAYKYCRLQNIEIQLNGIDVDPIAVMITRARLAKCYNDGRAGANIRLGNPLVYEAECENPIELFQMASEGRFYNSKMGIKINDKFDIIVGNPPWEKIRFEEKKFLQHYTNSKKIGLKKGRNEFVENLAKENRAYYDSILYDYDRIKKELKRSSVFLNTKCGELNTYALFTELSINLLELNGMSGLIVKSSLVKLPAYSNFMDKITKNRNLFEIYMFINRKKIFNIDSREEFSVIYLKASNKEVMKISLDLDDYEGFYRNQKIELPYEVIRLINPDTGMIPNIRNNEELQFLINVYMKHKVYGEVYDNCKFGRLVHLTNHSEYILTQKKENYLPIYEGKFIELYTGKYATFSDMNEADIYKSKATAKQIDDIEGKEYPKSRYYIKREIWENLSKNFNDGYIIAWRSLTSATNRRTMLATILPLLPTCQSIQMLQVNDIDVMMQILALFDSVVFDYIVRLKMAGLDLTQTIIKQIPVPCKDNYMQKILFDGVNASISEHINSRLYALYRNDDRISKAFEKVAYYTVNEGVSRKQRISEIDRLIAFLYEMDTLTLRKIVYTFDKFYTQEEVEKWF